MSAPPLIMRSRGGIVSAALAARQPVTLFLSGPAGGVIGARFAAERSGARDFVSLDMGGTSNDVGVVRDGAPLLVGEGAIGPFLILTCDCVIVLEGNPTNKQVSLTLPHDADDAESLDLQFTLSIAGSGLDPADYSLA